MPNTETERPKTTRNSFNFILLNKNKSKQNLTLVIIGNPQTYMYPNIQDPSSNIYVSKYPRSL